MAPKPGKNDERSAASATRFTATTPHASSKRAAPAPPARTPKRQPGPATAAAAAAARPAAATKPTNAESVIPPISPGAAKETPQQRVARLRAAHDAAKQASISPLDRFLEKTRPIFNSAHKITVVGLVGLTVVAGVMTGYTFFDMMRYNRKRTVEFYEAQQKMAADSLEAARLAYMRGEANDDQIQLVEEAHARAESQGFQLPSILSAPTPIRRDAADVKTAEEPDQTPAGGKSSKLLDMLPFWGTKKEGGKDAVEAEPKEAKPPRTFEEKQTMLEQARAAFDKEKENQRIGGPLDRLGSAETPEGSTPPKETEQPKKKGWLW